MIPAEMSEFIQRVWTLHHQSRPVMGAPDDTGDGHHSSFSGAKLTVIRELVVESKRLGHTTLPLDLIEAITNMSWA